LKEIKIGWSAATIWPKQSGVMALNAMKNGCADLLFATRRLVLGANRVRRARLYCVGTGKSGTHSIASMFSTTVRTGHETEAVPLMENFVAWKSGRMDEAQFCQWLHARDRRLALEVDSSTLNRDIIDVLIREFPDARFLLTIRDCYSWCNSHINHFLRFRHEMAPIWMQLGKWRMGEREYPHASEDRILKEQGLRSLDFYFAFWAWHNMGVLEQVPPDRLLVVRTDEIGKRAFEIAEFAALPRRAVRVERTHEFRNAGKQQILQQIDRDFVETTAERHCRPLMDRFFPEIKSLNDAKL
jgi:hypothetical protein